MNKNPIICAIDTTNIDEAKALANGLNGNVGAIKLGLEFFTAHGAKGVKEVTSSGVPFFLDLKFHDIPNTVAGAVKAATKLGAFMITIHTLGGKEMMKAAVKAAKEEADKRGIEKPIVLGVTMLTSMDESDLSDIGVSGDIKSQVQRLAELAVESGLDGCVCSAHEIEAIREVTGNELTLVVPGIRPEGSDAGDQKRVMTPKQAIKEGADYLVIGRPITQADSPFAAAKEIFESI